MDYFYLALIFLALVAAFYLITRLDKKEKNKHKKEAYRILDSGDASRKEIVKAIKMLRLYGGRWKKDKEFVQLVDRLITKLDKIDGIERTAE